MNEKLDKALDEISDDKIAEAAEAKRVHPIRWASAIAAVLATAILGTSLYAPRATSDEAPDNDAAPSYGYSTNGETAQQPAFTTPDYGSALLAAPVYPEMAPYPDESKYLESDNWDAFDLEYEAWREDQKAQRDQPAGYADSLDSYFSDSIPTLLSGSDSENAVCSPLNIYMALALLAETTDGESRQQILGLLGADSIDVLRTQAGQVWNAHYMADSASTCLLANSLWLDAELTYDMSTVKTLADSYYASVFQGDLGTETMDQMLRDWLNEQTGGLLQEQTQELSMDPDTWLALASTIYFRAKWNSEFNEDRNTEDIFHAPDGDKTVTYMNRTDSYGPYYWGDDFGAVRLGLEDGSCMWLILPDEGLTPGDLLESGKALAMVMAGAGGYENQKSIMVNIRLPKFDVRANMDLAGKLQELGITDVFSDATADFTPILPELGQDCWLDSVSHAARVKIDEEGVEAAAYTVMLTCGAGMPPEDEIDFILDRPFLFVITSHDNLPLFAGVVNDP